MLKRLEKYIEVCGWLLLPLFVFAFGLLYYLVYGALSYDTAVVFHHLFLVGNFILLLILLYFNQGRFLFFASVTFLFYLAINCLKHQYGADFRDSAYYSDMLCLFPFNLLMFYLFWPQRFISTAGFLNLLIILGEYILLDAASAYPRAVNYSFYGLNIPAITGFTLLVLISFVKMIKNGNIYDGTVLFVSLSLIGGIFFCHEASGISFFFCISVYTILWYVLFNLYNNRWFDEKTGAYNRYSYLKRSKFFPPKYSLGVISIDGFDGLSKALNSSQIKELIILLFDIIKENIDEYSTIYRYDDNRFIVVCLKNNQKEIYEIFETIRRTTAGAEFVLHGHQHPIKITISGGVAEKRRTDTGAAAVLMRANAEMQKTLQFTGNVISPQPLRNRRR